MKKVMVNSTESWNANVQCNSCGEHREIKAEDVLKKHVWRGLYKDDPEGFETDIYGFICPECDGFTQISEGLLPVNVKCHSKYVSNSKPESDFRLLDRIVSFFK